MMLVDSIHKVKESQVDNKTETRSQDNFAVQVPFTKINLYFN